MHISFSWSGVVLEIVVPTSFLSGDAEAAALQDCWCVGRAPRDRESGCCVAWKHGNWPPLLLWKMLISASAARVCFSQHIIYSGLSFSQGSYIV